MIRTLGTLILLCLGGLAMAQNLQNIVDHNPFDPMRGKVIEEPTDPEEPEVVPVNLPILDGTIIAGDKRIALLTLTDAGQQKSARVSLNQKFAQFTVTSIERNSVMLTSGSGAPVKLSLYSGKKENRGGTKTLAQPKANKAVREEKGPPVLNPNDPTRPDPDKDAKGKSDKKPELRRPPRQPRNVRAEDAKKRF